MSILPILIITIGMMVLAKPSRKVTSLSQDLNKKSDHLWSLFVMLKNYFV